MIIMIKCHPTHLIGWQLLSLFCLLCCSETTGTSEMECSEKALLEYVVARAAASGRDGHGKDFSLTQGGIPVFLIKPNSKIDRRAAWPTIPSPFDRFVSNLVEGHLSRFRSCIMTHFEKECDSRKMELHRGAARDRRVQPG